MQKAIIYEPWAHGMAHFEFIKAFIKTIASLYEDVFFIGEQSLIGLLRLEPELDFVQFKVFQITTYNTLMGKFFAIPKEVKNVQKIKHIAKNADIYFSFGAPHSMLISEKILRKQRVFYVQHMALQAIHEKLGRTKLNHYVLPAIKKLPSFHKIIVLGDSIKANLLRDVPSLLSSQIISIDHPFFMTQSLKETEPQKSDECIHIGTVGLGTAGKGYGKLNEIGEYIFDKGLSNKIKLYHIGKLLGVSVDEKYVYMPFSRLEMIPSEPFNLEIKKLDYILFLYPADSYKLVASGAIFDAFKFGKPIIALKNDYFMYLCQKGLKFGYLFDKLEELEKFLCNLPRGDSDEYRKISQNSLKMLAFFSPEVIAEQLKEQL